jgi:exodeoxyribonuclease-5
MISATSLSPDQRAAYDGIVSWLNRGAATKRTLSLGGYAGAGKSTVVGVIAHELLKLGPIAFCAFTGKASSVLARKLADSGIETVNRIFTRAGSPRVEPRPYCGTIHGLIFRPCDACMSDAKYEHTFEGACVESELGDTYGDEYGTRDPAGPVCLACNPPPPVKREGPCHRCKDARYFRQDRLDRAYRLIVIDEASMVSDDILQTLLSYNVPILAVGDHGQLPPVRGQGSLMMRPDLRLEKIHRQAEGNPIIALSARVRETGDIDDSLEDGKAFTIVARRNMPEWIAERFRPARLAADTRGPNSILNTVLVSWTNKLRVNLNYDVRAALGREGSPADGDVVICLKNKAPIYNGMRGVIAGRCDRVGSEDAPKWRGTVDFVEDGQVAKDVQMSEHQFFAEKTIDYDMAQEIGLSMSQLGALYDFGYALTAHKMQGSQAPDVGVVIEPGLFRMGREDRARWIYTAITRSSERLTVIR